MNLISQMQPPIADNLYLCLQSLLQKVASVSKTTCVIPLDTADLITSQAAMTSV
jgi:hypothetical protein